MSYLLIALLAYIDAIEYGFLIVGLILFLCALWMLTLKSKIKDSLLLVTD